MNLYEPNSVALSLFHAGMGLWAWSGARPEELLVRFPAAGADLHGAGRDLSAELRASDWRDFREHLTNCQRNSESIDFDARCEEGPVGKSRLHFRGKRVCAAIGRVEAASGVFWQADADKEAEVGSSHRRPGPGGHQCTPDDLLAELSHELRSPLTALAFQADNLREQLSGRAGAREAGEIYHQSTYLLQLVDNLLEHARSRVGKRQLQAECVSTRQLIRDSMLVVRGLARAKAIQLQVETESGFPTEFWTASVNLRRILHNLLDNAVKFTGAGVIRLRLGTRDHGPGRLLLFDVIDSGPGIAAEDIEHVFSPYARGRSASGYPGGLGLGLAVSRRLAKELGGTLEALGESGSGCTFQLRLPLLTGGEESTAAKVSDRACANVAALALGAKVLLVEITVIWR